jgi:hypothetical protein
MKDIFNNPEFDKFLYGGIKDLEEGVGPLVYAIYKLGFVQPCNFSCGGHLGQYDSCPVKSTREGYIFTADSYLEFRRTPSLELENLAKFQRIVLNAVRSVSFGSYRWNETFDTTITLGFQDLVEPISEDERARLLALNDNNQLFNDNYMEPIRVREHEVRLDLAQARHQEIKSIWSSLEKRLRDEFIFSFV